MTMQWTALVALLVVTVALAVGWRATQGRARTTSQVADAGHDGGADWADVLASAGTTLGERATFLQLSAEVCSSCRSTARTLGDLAAATPGVVHVEIDVDDRPDLVRATRMLRTPTVLVLDPDGAEAARASGAMTPAQARTALTAVEGTRTAGRTS